MTSPSMPDHLGDVGDPAGAVAQAGEVDDEVDGRGDLLADRPHRQVHARPSAPWSRAGTRASRGRVGVDRGQRAVVAGVHRLEHVERLAAADLADDDPVGAHAQRVAHQVADGDLALALDVRRAGSRGGPRGRWCSWSSAASSMVTIRSSSGMNAESTLSSVVLPVPVPPRDEDVEPARARRPRSSSAISAVSVPNSTRSSTWKGRLENLRMVSDRAVDGQRRDDGVDPGAVGQPGVDHRRRLVDAAADLADDPLDHPAQVLARTRTGRRCGGACRPARRRSGRRR